LPDVPGCISCGDTIDEGRAMIQEALEFHLDGMQRGGLPIPAPTTISDYVLAVRD
jgi:predicted RNase H-like HicB family nuclease